MDVWIALVAGIAIGWLIEWVIDWQYWRRGLSGFYQTEAELRHAIAEQQAQIQDTNAALEQMRHELSATRAQLHAAQAQKPGAAPTDIPRRSADQ